MLPMLHTQCLFHITNIVSEPDCGAMLDDRALAVDPQHIQCIPVLKRSSPGRAWASRWGTIAALQVAEVLVVVTNSTLWLAVILSGKAGDPKGEALLLAFGLAMAALVHFGLRSGGAYDFVDIVHMWRSSRMAAAAWVLSTAPASLIAFLLTPVTTGRMVLLGWLTGLFGLICVRMAAARICQVFVRARWLRHNILVIGTGPEAKRCANSFRADNSGAHVVGVVSLDTAFLTDRHEGGGAVPLSDLQRLINANDVKDVIVSTSCSEQALLSDLIRSLRWLPVRVFLWPPSLGVQIGLFAKGGYTVGNVSLLLAGVPPLVGWHWVVKDVRDRLLAFLLLIFTSPVLLGIVLMIRLTSPGPILFRQQREGYGGSMFTIFKFRTMRVSSSPTLILTERDDPRVFPVGALLRKTSLDELPQLINVIRGDMWLVGPRPHSPLATAAGQRYSAAVYGYMARLRVKPGITGWAQVNGWRGPTNTIEQIQQRFTYDLHYIEHLSFWLDLQVLLKTAVKGFVHKNAY
jgi:Undecaprenyl-phosphate glucose phosphotransferase